MVNKPVNKATKIPEHQSVYQQLRDLLLLGKMEPGQPLTIMGLAESLNVGMTPVREALRRLSAENAVSTLENRRIVVPKLSAPDIRDIYFLRFKVEPELAARTAKCISPGQIESLNELDKAIDAALEKGDIETYLERNNKFHFMIYDIAKAPVLFNIARSLWVQVGPSLRVVCGRYDALSLPDKHAELLQAFRSGNAAASAQAMKGDLQQSLSLITTPEVAPEVETCE